MSFKVDHSQAGSSELPEGEYEAIIKYAGEDATKISRTEYINVTMVVRNDIDQPCKNRTIRHSIWHKKEPSPADVACGGYSSKQIQSLSKAVGLPNGKEYDNLEDWCEDLANKPVRITVEKEEYQGQTHSRVRWINESKSLPCRHVWKGYEDVDDAPAESGLKSSNEFQEVKASDDDLPF